MRKALIGLIMAATVLSPIAAQAQEWRGARGDRGGRASMEQRQSRAERQAPRSESRSERQATRASRSERQAARAARTEGRRQAAPSTPAAVTRGQGTRGQDTRGQDRSARQVTRQERRSARQTPAAVTQRDRQGRRGSVYPDAWQGNRNDPARRHYEQLERRNQYRYGTSEQRREIRREQRDNRDWRGNRDRDRNWRGDRDRGRDWRGNRDWRRDWDRNRWRNDRRYDWRNWRNHNRHIYRLPPYYAPYRGYRYSRFSIGLILEPLFYNRNYWISDPWSYRLPPAPPGTQWIRYYDDVLLVDVYNGEVIDVIYNFFW